MIRTRLRRLATAALVWAALVMVLPSAQTVRAQQPAPSPAEERVPLTAEALEELVGPIALYPDDLVSLVLPASTYPLQIVQASRYLAARESDSGLEPDADWDDSVVALLNYPEALERLNEDLDWTWALGEAVLYQQAAVLDAIQAFRDRAYTAGNLQTDDRQVVTREAETIVIKPADPQVIYIPYYEPRSVLRRHPYSVYHYHPYPYPVYYYPYPFGHSFGSGLFWGVTSAYSIGWHNHYLNVHPHRHRGHPYFGHAYHYPWYRRLGVRVGDGSHIWRPGRLSGARQRPTADVRDTDPAPGATPPSRGRLRNQPVADTTPRAPRLRDRTANGGQLTVGGRRGGVRSATAGARRVAGGRTPTAVDDTVDAARAASNRSSNRRPGATARTRTGTPAHRRGLRPGPLANPPGSTAAITPPASGQARSDSPPRTIVRHQPRLRNQPGSVARQTLRPLGDAGARLRTQAAPRPGFGGRGGGAGTVQRGSPGSAAGGSAPAYGGGGFRGAPGARPNAGAFGGTASRPSGPGSRAGGSGGARAPATAPPQPARRARNQP